MIQFSKCVEWSIDQGRIGQVHHTLCLNLGPEELVIGSMLDSHYIYLHEFEVDLAALVPPAKLLMVKKLYQDTGVGCWKIRVESLENSGECGDQPFRFKLPDTSSLACSIFAGTKNTI